MCGMPRCACGPGRPSQTGASCGEETAWSRAVVGEIHATERRRLSALSYQRTRVRVSCVVITQPADISTCHPRITSTHVARVGQHKFEIYNTTEPEATFVPWLEIRCTKFEGIIIPQTHPNLVRIVGIPDRLNLQINSFVCYGKQSTLSCVEWRTCEFRFHDACPKLNTGITALSAPLDKFLINCVLISSDSQHI